MSMKEIEVVVLPGGRMDSKNAARYVGLSAKTLAALRSRGKGPRYAKRGRIFYRLDDLEAWLDGGEHVSTSQNACESLVALRSASTCKPRRHRSADRGE